MTDRLRYSVILIIVVAFAGGIWTRYLSTLSVDASTPVEINPALLDPGLQLTGTFGEPYGDLTGFEVSFPNYIYPEAWISYKLSLLNSYYRLQAFFSVGEARQFAYYLKIWIPADCPGISTTEVFALERVLAATISAREKPR